MSYFGKVKFGNDATFEDAAEVAENLRNSGYEVNEQPENGYLYFSQEEGEE